MSAAAGVDLQGRGRRGQGLNPMLQEAETLTKLLGAAGPPECCRAVLPEQGVYCIGTFW